MATGQCAACGAPDDGEAVLCKYCGQAVSAEVRAHAIPCPRCRSLARWGKQRCPACQAWVVVSCVFCGALSPHNQQACLACREPFAGAAERKAAQQQQHQHAQAMQTFGVVGNVAASFLGAAAGAAVGGHFSHSHDDYSGSSSWGDSGGGESVDTWVDNTTEDTGGDWGGGGDDFGGGDWGGDG